MLTCYRCIPPKEPVVLVIEKVSTAPLCTGCGNQMIQIVEQLPFPVEEFLAAREAEARAAYEAQEVEKAQEIIRQAQEEGEIVEVMEPPLKTYEEATEEPAKVLEFEEIDMMTDDEIGAMVNKLDLGLKEGTSTADARTAIKSYLAVKNVKEIEKG